MVEKGYLITTQKVQMLGLNKEEKSAMNFSEHFSKNPSITGTKMTLNSKPVASFVIYDSPLLLDSDITAVQDLTDEDD